MHNLIEKLQTDTRWHLAIIILLPLAIYARIVSFQFVGFDDNGIILNNIETLKQTKKIASSFTTDAFFQKNGDFYRPIQNVTFFIDAAVSKEKPWMYHLTNLVIHLLTCISLYYFLQLLDFKKTTAFLMAVLFSVHPLFASDLAWVPSRGDILIGLLGILLFMTFALYFKKKKIIYFILHAILFFVIIFTKETTVLFPLFLLYYYFLVLKERFSVKKLLPFAIVWGGIFAGFFLMRKHVVLNTAPVDVFGLIPFLKNNPVIPTIAGQFFVPFNLASLPLYNNAATITGIICLIVIVYFTFEYAREKKWLALLGLAWFLLFVIPPTIYRLDNADCFFTYLEHRTYLPLIGLVIIAAFFTDKQIGRKNAAWMRYTFLGVILIFSVLSFYHAGDYRNNYTFGKSAASSNNPTGYSILASNLLIEKKDTAGALDNIERSVALCPKAELYAMRGKIRSAMQLHAEAEQDFTLAINLAPNIIELYTDRSVERRYLKNFEPALRDIYYAIKYDPKNPRIHFSCGNLLIATKNYSEAINSFTNAIRLQPKFGEAYSNRAYTKLLMKDYEGAIADARSAGELLTKNAYVYNNMGQAYLATGRADSALNCFSTAIVKDSLFAEAWYQRGNVYRLKNDKAAACKNWDRAIELGYRDTTHTIAGYCR